MDRKCFLCLATFVITAPVTTTRTEKPGDVLICCCCGSVYMITEELNIREIRQIELDDMMVDNPKGYQELRKMQLLIANKIKQN